MTEVEQNILRTLVDLEHVVKAMPSANPKPNLLPLFSRLDQLMRQLPRDADPNLLHYLHKKSYEKARLLLEGRGVENTRGSCRRPTCRRRGNESQI
jgi:hypothetical protein